MAKELATNCTLRRHDGAEITLEISPGRSQLRTESTEQTLAGALGGFLGSEVRLRVEVKDQESESPAARGERKDRERVERAARALRGTPDVQDVVQRFEGELNLESVEPPE